MERTEYRRADIRPSRLNPRKNFDEDGLNELAASIKEKGVQQPILIRQTSPWAQVCEWVNACGKGAKLGAKAFKEARFEPDDWERAVTALKADGRVSDSGRYAIAEEPKPVNLLDPRLGEPFIEIVAGERRWRASGIAGLETIPAILREPMSDSEALELALMENNQRKNLLPCEEAEGFAMQIKLSGRTAADVAQRAGKSESYVRKRLLLCRLPEEFKRAVDEHRVTLGAAFAVARVADPLVTECAGKVLHGWGNRPLTDDQTNELIMREYMTDLSRAPFKTEDPTLVPEAGACGPCKFRTGNDPGLFDDIRAKSICSNTACFASKIKAHMERKIEEAKSQGLKIMDSKEAKQELRYGKIGYGSKYVDLNETQCSLDPKMRKYGRILREVKPIVAVGPDNHVHYLLPKKEADDLVRQTLKIREKASTSSSNHDNTYKKEQEAARRRKEAAVKARNLATAAVEQFMPKPTPKGHIIFRAMLIHTIDNAGHDAIKQALTQRPLKGLDKNDYNAPRRAAVWAASAKLSEVFAFAVDVILASGLSSYTSTYGGEKRLRPAAHNIFDALGIDVIKIEQEIARQANEKKKAAEAKKSEREKKKRLKAKVKSGKGSTRLKPKAGRKESQPPSKASD